jgi:hypothetical protein
MAGRMRRCIRCRGGTPEGRDRQTCSGLGIARGELPGFRTPYLEYSDRTLTAVQQEGFAYDCSLEEGTQDGHDGRNFVWPYLLDGGSPGVPEIGPHPGLWEIPVYVFVVPPTRCERPGVAPGCGPS